VPIRVLYATVFPVITCEYEPKKSLNIQVTLRHSIVC
jgi:hypothetical protein